MKKKAFALLGILLCLALCLSFGLVACKKAPVQNENVQHPIVEFRFSTGDVVRFALFPEEAPITVANFLRYVEEGFYTGTIIHRVESQYVYYQGSYYRIPFVVQGGGYTQNYTLKTTHEPIKGEFSANGVQNNVKHVRGALSMARADVDSATSQFFFCPIDMEQWDGNYAAFGQALDDESLAAITNLARVETLSDDPNSSGFSIPKTTIVIESVTLIGYQE